jgi:hypothetical protein
MKKITYIISALALVSAAPAFAANPQAIAVNGTAVAQCAITAPTTSVSLGTDLADANGFARAAVSSEIASGLQALNIKAWCSGNTNSVVISRTALVRDGAASADLGTDGFANAIHYDLDMFIDGAVRGDGFGPETDGSSDGAGFGPTTVSAFGPSGDGAALTFAANGTSKAVKVDNGSGPTAAFTLDNTIRVRAGDYKGNVTITLSPGV